MANEQTIANLIVRLSAQTTELTTGLKRAETEVRTFQTGITSVVRSIGVGLAGMFGAFAAFSSIRQAAAEAREFGKAMSEVSTLLPKDADMRPLVDGAKEAAKSFGGRPLEQTKAYYQIISSVREAALDAAKATEILTAANKLAVGGVTSVSIAADGLTNILNAYKIEASRSEEVTDAMFVAMRAGKTTIGELSSSIGKVAPIAAQTGVALDDLLAAVAALTTGGIETRIAVNGVRAVLAAIAKPSTEAADLAKQLKINFSAAGLEAKGFAGFLAEVKEKTGGSTESLAKLFGGVESLVPIMSLAGNAGKDYAAILGDMATKAGQTEEAFDKMSKDVSFKLDQLKAVFTVLAINAGEKLLNAILPAVTAIVKHFDSIVKGVQLLSAVIVSRLVTAIVLYNIQLAQSIVQGLRATAVLTGYSSSAILAAVRIRAAGLAANIAAGQFGILSGALALLGGPIGLIITGLTVAATAWTLFGQKAKEGGDSAIDEIHKMVTEFGKVPKPHQAILDAIQKETLAIETQTVRLREMRADLEKNASAAESMMLAMGDVGAVNTLQDIDRQLDANAAKMRRLAQEQIALEEKVRKAGEAKEEETKPPPIAITPPEVLAARHKANLKISQAAMAEELVVLEDSYKQGAIGLEAYYDRRRAILTEKIREEVALLKKEQGAKETKPERREEIRAEVFALESAGRTEIVKVTREQADAYRDLFAAIGEGDLAGFVARNNLLLGDLENQFADGLVSTQDFFAQRRRIIEENAAAAITNVEDQIVPGMDPAAAEGAANRIKAIRAQLALDLKKVDREEVEQVRENESEKWRIRQAFAQLKADAARGGTGAKVQARYDAELAAAKAAHAQELASYVAMTDAQLEVATGFHDRAAALDFVRQEQAAAIAELQERQAQARFDALMNEAAAYGNVELAVETLMGKEGDRQAALLDQQEQISFYQQVWRDANAGIWDSVSSVYGAMQEGISNVIVGVTTGAATAADVIRGLGSAMLKIIADYIAKKTMAFLFEKALMASQVATAVAAATATAAALAPIQASIASGWTVAAVAASIATSGALAAEGVAAYIAALTAGVTATVAIQAASRGASAVAMEEGGPVTSGSGTKDDVPALLTRGEYVQTRQAVDYYGLPFMEAIRRKVFPIEKTRGIAYYSVARPKFAFETGGMVSGGGASTGGGGATRQSGDGGDRQQGRLTQLVVDGRVFGEWFMDEVAFGRIKLVPR